MLAARGSELEREFPFGVVRQLFEPALADAGLRASACSTGAAAPAAPIFEAVAGRGAATQADASFAVLHGLYWLTVNLRAEQPLLLVVDDLHWCDRPSLRFLAYLVRRLEGLPVLVVAQPAPGGAGRRPGAARRDAQRPAHGGSAPGPLSEAAVRGARARPARRRGRRARSRRPATRRPAATRCS